jgi:hypothetical protein
LDDSMVARPALFENGGERRTSRSDEHARLDVIPPSFACIAAMVTVRSKRTAISAAATTG